MFPCIGCDPSDLIGAVQKDGASGLYFTINNISTQLENGKVKSKTLTYDVYSSFTWNEGEKKYKGVDKVDTKTEVWNYDDKGNRTTKPQREAL